MMKVKYYNCPECGKKFKTLNGWGNHVDTIHPGLRPKDYSISRYFYFTKTGKTAGVCRTCKKPTPWNEESMKYDQYCTNPECKKAYVAIAKKRMMDKYGKTHLLDDPEHQKKMLKNRKIAGKYKFQDGTQFEYVGTYERKFLAMLDTLFDWHSNDLMAPSPHTYYYDYTNPKDKENEGRKFYIPDFYIPSLNLEIEIKQQTSTNQAFNDVNRAKERIKDDIMSHNPKVNYLKLNDNHFEPFFELLMKAKEQVPSEKEEKSGEFRIAQESSFRKEDGEGSSITMEDIKAFNKQLNSWKYGVLINGKIEKDQDKIDWSKYKTTPIPIMMKKHVGVCWDFVNYEYHWFTKNNIDTRSYLFVMQRSDDPNDIVTHTFLIFNFNKQNYWFESSWYGHQWIKEVKSYKDVVKDLVKRYGNHPYDVYTYNPEGLDRNLTNTEFFQNTTQNLIFSTNHHKPSKEVLYHGSSINLKDGQMLIPKNDSHDFGDAVFASSDRDFALCYSGGKWDDTIIRQGYYDGKLYLIEMEKGAFKKVFDRKGYLYSVRKSNSFKKGAMPNEFYSETKVPFLSKMPIDNVYDELKRIGVDLYTYPKKPHWFKDISMESYGRDQIKSSFLEKGDSCFNLNLWDRNKSNILYITGVSGSGKTTLAEDIAKQEHVDRVELDYISVLYMDRTLDYPDRYQEVYDDLKKDCEIAVKFIDQNPPAKYGKKKTKFYQTQQVVDDFCKWFAKEVQYTGKRYIVNGAHLVEVYPVEHFYDKPLIIKHINFAKTVYRRTIREFDIKEPITNNFKNMYQAFHVGMSKWYRDANAKFANMRDDLSKNAISMESKDASFIEKDFKGKPIQGIRYIDGTSAEAWKYYKRYQADNLYKNMKDYWLSFKGAKAVLAIDSKKDMIAGYVCVRKEGSVQPIFVYPDYRGHGISKELMKRAIKDCGACTLGVYSDNQVAIKLYKSLGFKEYDRKKYKDNDEAILMRLDKNAMEPAQESVVLSKPDQWYNFDKFARGDTNLCFVTGRCGSGKSTLTKKISTLTDAEHVELDWLLFNSGLNPASSELEGEMMHDFFRKDGKKYKFSNDDEFEELAKKFKGNIELLEKTLTNDFVTFAKKYAEKHPRKKFILEGVHFFYYVNPKDVDGDYAVCIMGTSALKSIVRMHKRDQVDWKKYKGTFFEKTKDKLKLWLRDAGTIYDVETRLDVYRNYFFQKEEETSRHEHSHSLRPLEMAPKIGSPKKTILVRGRTNPNEKRSIVTFPVKGYPTARGRSEIIIFRGNDIFIDTKQKGFPSIANPNSNAMDYSIPGGGWEPDETPLQSAIREAQEEARINTTVMLPWGEYYYAGSYMYVMKEVPSWQKKAVPKEFQWRAQYTQVFIGCYQSKFTGHVDKEDELPSMVRNGKFVDCRKVYDKLHPVHQRAIDIYLEAQKEWDELHGKRTMKTKRKNKYQVMEALNSDLLRNTRAQYKVVGDASKVLQEKAVYCDSIDIIMESSMSTYLAKNGYNGITKDGEYKYVLGPGVFGKKVNSIDMESGIWQDGILMEPVKESIDPIKHPPIDFEDILRILDMFPYDKSDFYVSYRAALVLRGIVPFTKDINLIINENLRNELERDGYRGEQVELQFEDEPMHYRFTRYQINEYLECIYREDDIPTSVALVFDYQVVGMNVLYSLYKKGRRFKDRQTFNQIEEYQNSIANSPNFMEQEIDDVIDNSNIKIDDLHLMDDQTALEQARFTKYERYPVYIVLMHTGTAMSQVIKFATGDRFSHALISFHAGLAPLYSFGKNDFLPEISDVVKERSKKSFHIGFVKQANGPDDKFYDVFKNTEYAVYVMFVSKQARDKMKARLSEFLKTQYEWKYDFFNLLSCKAGIPSESSKKYFCSRFVMEIINAGKKTDKVPSLYKPQDLVDLNNITCVAEGKDFRKYDKKITMRNIDYLREGTPEKISMESTWMEELEGDDPFDIPVSYQMPAIESMADDLAMENLFSGLLKFSIKHGDKGVTKDVNKFSWKSLFSRSILGSPFGNYKRYRVKVKDGNIEIYGINYKNLQTRIKKYYQDKSIFHMFLPKYNILSYRAFERKRIQRSDIKIDYIYAPDFFALEMATLFADLGARFRDTAYKAIAKQIYEISWLKMSDVSSEQAPLLDTTPAKKALTYQLNDYQEDFISKYLKLKAQLNMNGYILAFEQGLGKTLTAIALSECLHIDHVYIVCPNSLKENWALEIQKYYKKYEDDDTWRSEVFICSDKEVLFNKHTTKFLIINNESIKKMMPYVMPGKNMLILDESHSFRNINAKRLQDLFALRDKMQPTDTLIMSGTPIKATPAEIVPSLMLIDPTCTQEAATLFTKAFKLKSSIGTSIVQARFGKIMYRKEKDVLEDKLPAKIVEDRFYKMSGSNKYLMSHVMQLVNERFNAIYDEGYKEFRSKEKPFLQMSHRYGNRNDYGRFVSCIREMVTKDKYLHEVDRIFVEDYMKECKTKMKPEVRKNYDALIKSYVRYKAHCLGLAFGEILPKYRRDLFIDLFDANINEFVDMINDNTKKVVIFSQFKGVVEHINDELNKHDVGTVMITGDITKRMPILKEFKENPQIQVLVATSQTVGTGMTLTEASMMLFFGTPYRDSDFAQCTDRIHRIGQTDDCYIYNVLLDTGDELNLSTRINNIIKWSHEMTSAIVNRTEDDEDLDDTKFVEVLSTDAK